MKKKKKKDVTGRVPVNYTPYIILVMVVFKECGYGLAYRI